MFTVYAASPTAGTPLFVAAAEVVRKLHVEAEAGGVTLDWAAGVTLRTVEPDAATLPDGTALNLSGITLLQAEAHTIETD